MFENPFIFEVPSQPVKKARPSKFKVVNVGGKQKTVSVDDEDFKATIRRIRAELLLPFSDRSDPGLLRRRARLRQLFAKIPSMYRRRFHEQLGEAMKNDPLSRLFHGRLATATRKELLEILRRNFPAIRVLKHRPLPPSEQGRFLSALTQIEQRIQTSGDPRKSKFLCLLGKLRSPGTDDRLIQWGSLCTSAAPHEVFDRAGACDFMFDRLYSGSDVDKAKGVVFMHLKSTLVLAHEQKTDPLAVLLKIWDETEAGNEEAKKVIGSSARRSGYRAMRDWIRRRLKDPNSVYSCF